MRADPMRLSRTARLVSHAPDDRLVLAVQTAGRMSLHQDGRTADVLPGEMALLDLHRPFSLEQREPFGLYLIRVPGAALGSARARVPQATGRKIPDGHGVAALLGPFVSALVTEADRTPDAVGDLLAGNVTDLLVTLIDEQTTARRPRAHSARDGLRVSVRRYIDDHLRDPDLCPAAIADAHGISVRYLHLLFEDEETTVSRLIQRRRVEECARELSRRDRATPTISAVAHSWGFANAGHFGRLFKSLYGCSPREWRAARACAASPR
jgi:AraC-like DNA-binding protein